MDFFIPYAHPSGDLGVVDSCIYAPSGLPITNKDVVYTPMGGSPTISVKVYVHYGVSTKHDRNSRC